MDIPAVPFQYVKDCVAEKVMIPMRDWFGECKTKKRNDVYYHQRTNLKLFPLPDNRSREIEEINQCVLEYVQSGWSRPLKTCKRRTIYIQPFVRRNEKHQKSWSPNSKELRDRMTSFLKSYFGCQVKTMSPLFIDQKEKHCALVRFKRPLKGKKRRRTETIEVKRRTGSKKMPLLSVLDLLDVVHAVLPSDAYIILGVTDVDIYETDDCMDGSLRGRAFGGSRIAVFSTAPLRRDLSDKSVSIAKAWSYMFGTVAHETLHCFGLDHCGLYRCCMNSWSDTMVEFGGSSVENGDLVVGCIHLCPICIHKLYHCAGFCLKERLKCLSKTYVALGIKEQADWCDALLSLTK